MDRIETVRTRVLTVQEVSKYLRVHPSTIYRMLKKNQLPAFRVGSDWRFTVEAIDKWRAEAEQGALGRADEQMSQARDASSAGAARLEVAGIAKIQRGAETDAVIICRHLSPHPARISLILLALEISARVVN